LTGLLSRAQKGPGAAGNHSDVATAGLGWHRRGSRPHGPPAPLSQQGTGTVGSRVNCRLGLWYVTDNHVLSPLRPGLPPPCRIFSSLTKRKKAVGLHSRGSALVFLLPKAPMRIPCARGKRNIDGIRHGNLAASSLSGRKRRTCECTAAPPHRRSCVVAAATWNGSPCVVTTVGRRGRCHNRRVLWNSHAPALVPVHLRAKRTGKRRRRRALAHMPRLPGTPGHVGRALHALEPTTRAARDGAGVEFSLPPPPLLAVSIAGLCLSGERKYRAVGWRTREETARARTT
jgi:hypothetical protein